MTEVKTYAVTWQDGDARSVGYAEVGADELRLEGRGAGGAESVSAVPYTAIDRVDVRRTNGSRGLVVELLGSRQLVIGSLDGPGTLGELSDRLRKLREAR
jgi:hypothetical protein